MENKIKLTIGAKQLNKDKMQNISMMFSVLRVNTYKGYGLGKTKPLDTHVITEIWLEYVQEVFTHLCSKLLYKLGNYFLDIWYILPCKTNFPKKYS